MVFGCLGEFNKGTKGRDSWGVSWRRDSWLEWLKCFISILWVALQGFLFVNIEIGLEDQLGSISCRGKRRNWKGRGVVESGEHSVWASGVVWPKPRLRSISWCSDLPLNLDDIHRFASCLWAPVCLLGGTQLSRKAGGDSCQLVVHLVQLNRLNKEACFAH